MTTDLARAISRGLLPSIYFSDDPGADLEAYAGGDAVVGERLADQG